MRAAVSVSGRREVLEQFEDLTVPGIQVGDARAPAWQSDDRTHVLIVGEPYHRHTKQVTIKNKRPVELRHGDADVMDAAHGVAVHPGY